MDCLMDPKYFVQTFEKIIGRKPLPQDQKDKEILARLGRQLQVSPRTVGFWLRKAMNDSPWDSSADKWGNFT
jgi:hypothetical protein